MPNLYADVDMFEKRFTQDTAISASDLPSVVDVLEGASRLIDAFTNRFFYVRDNTTRIYDGTGRVDLYIDDLLNLQSIKLDQDGDGVFELALATTDYWLVAPGKPDPYGAMPKTAVWLNTAQGRLARWPKQRRLVQVVGDWGYTDRTFRLSPTATLADATTTTMTTSASAGLAIGQTIRVESEQIYIRSGSGTTWTVDRGVNGSTPVAHSSKPIDLFIYVPEVREATLIQAGRLWKRREAGYAGAFTSIPLSGPFQFTKELDADLQAYLQPLWRPPYAN